MTHSLRDRIAEILVKDAFGMTTSSAAYRQADKVIAELKLTPETSYGTTYPNTPVQDRRLVRYVTDWMVTDD